MHPSRLRLRTLSGLRLAEEQLSFIVPDDPVARRHLACAIDREADLALSEGRRLTAELLSRRAEAIRDIDRPEA
jgi:hypothetical protein